MHRDMAWALPLEMKINLPLYSRLRVGTDAMCVHLFRLLWRGRRWLPRRPGTWGA